MDGYSFDLGRIFLGDLPPLFLLEIALRTTILFGYTMIILRVVGHRGLGQLSMAEFTLIIALGSAVGDPMIYADVPLIHGMFALTIMVLLQRFFTYLNIHSKRIRHIFEGETIRLVKDGAFDLDGVRRAHMSAKEIFAELRQGGAEDLRQVKRAYLETDGQVSVFLYGERPPVQHVAPFSLMIDGDENPDVPTLAPTSPARCPHCGLSIVAAPHAHRALCPNCRTPLTVNSSPSAK
ncbi:MAG: DUF421 domain-containing protein [Anaerolineae bacterium]|nr:DUF421 domain-containing protein [Anaerolineae bacterium]